MTDEPPAFLMRESRPSDHRILLSLARELDSINLPAEPRELTRLLERSQRSFRGRIRNRAASVYVFCAEELVRHRVVGASMIIGKHGTPESPHFYLEVGSDERYSHTLKKMFRHSYLRLRHSMDGPTELGGLIVTRTMRRRPERIGRQLSWVRFLYLALHPERFEPRALAEMLPPTTPGHGNLFWDHYGRRVTGLSFREADRLSIHDKEFIQALFPDSPLYTFLLPEEVRNALGQVGEGSRGAATLLEQAGMRFLEQIDPFDAGPYYGAALTDLEPVRHFRTLRAVGGVPDPERCQDSLVAREDDDGFRAVRAFSCLEGANLVVERAVLQALKIHDRALVSVVPLP